MVLDGFGHRTDFRRFELGWSARRCDHVRSTQHNPNPTKNERHQARPQTKPRQNEKTAKIFANPNPIKNTRDQKNETKNGSSIHVMANADAHPSTPPGSSCHPINTPNKSATQAQAQRMAQVSRPTQRMTGMLKTCQAHSRAATHAASAWLKSSKPHASLNSMQRRAMPRHTCKPHATVTAAVMASRADRLSGTVKPASMTLNAINWHGPCHAHARSFLR